VNNNKDHSGRFAAATHEDWEALAKKSLRGADPDSLSVTTADDIKIAPLYARARDLVDTLGQYPYTRATPSTQSAPEIRQRYTTNALILQELNLGVTGVQLDFIPQNITPHSTPPVYEFARLLDGVYLDLVKVSLSPGPDFANVSAQLRTLWQTRESAIDADKPTAQKPTAAFNADPLASLASQGELPTSADAALASMATLAQEVDQHCPGSTAVAVDTSIYHNAGASDGQELALLLATGKLYLQAMVDAGMSVSAACRQIECTLAVDTDFFASVASARAARTLWAKMTHHCGAQGSACELRLAITTSSRMLSRYDVWTNQLRTTVATSAALLAGADTLTVQPFDLASDEPGDVGRRMARNTTNILLEESGLHHVCDPLGGSGYIEDLTDALCVNAWSRFQQLEKTGGLLHALRSNQLQNDIESARETLLDAVAHRRMAIVGVNEFPNLQETSQPNSATETANNTNQQGSCADDTTAERVQRLQPFRLAEHFETLRQRADATAAQRGVRPTITSFCFGTPAQYLPLLQFCENLFASGGIAISAVWPPVDSSTLNSANRYADQTDGQPADLAVDLSDLATLATAAKTAATTHGQLALICLPSQATSTSLAEVTKTLRESGMQFLYFAGKPDGVDPAAGISGFLHRGGNTVETLDAALKVLEDAS